MRDQQWTWIIGLMLVLTTSCRKEMEGSPPSVEFLLPGHAFTVQIPDTFTVSVRVSDDDGLEGLSIMLVNEAGSPIAQTVIASLNGTTATVDREMIVTDERILSGNYTLIARATDGSNEARAFRSINVQAAPLRLRAVFIAPPFTNSAVQITRVDSAGNISIWTTVNDLNAAAIDGRGQHLLLAGAQHAPLTALPTSEFSGTWQVPNENALSLPYFNNVQVDPTDGRIYVTSNDGRIRGISIDGTQHFAAQAISDHRPFATVVAGEKLVCEQRSIALPESRLAIYTQANGSLLTYWPLDLAVERMFRTTDDKVLVFGARNGDGVIEERSITLGGNFEMRVFDEERINAVARLSDNLFILALTNGIHRFDRNTNSVTLLAPLIATTLAYQEAGGVVLVGSGDQLIAIDPMNGSMGEARTMPTPIGTILPLLNR